MILRVPWRAVWQTITWFATDKILPALWITLRWFLVAELLILAVCLWLVEAGAKRLRKNPQAFTAGMNPVGAAPVIRWGSGRGIWVMVQARRWLGRYVEKYHPTLFPHLQGLFA